MNSNGKKALKVVVGMSGGVDSSVAAYLLKKQGYDVVGLFMKNWEEVDGSGTCTAEADFADVKRVCEVLNIPYYSINFSKQYMDKVFSQFLDGLKRGVTPNPDILCNREIKFGPFLEFADKIGADFIATGHYSRVKRGCMAEQSCCDMPYGRAKLGNVTGGSVQLLKAIDDKKDQSYFLCGLSQRQLSRVIFPLGELEKTEVRKIAKQQGLVTADKKDSTGICFIGERKIRDFLKDYLGNKPGYIKTLDGEIVGKHVGLMYYTIGQRKGLGIGGFGENTERWFVIRKDLGENVLYVNNGECSELFSKSLTAINFNWIAGEPAALEFEANAKVRYRQPDQKCKVCVRQDGSVNVVFDKPQRAVTSGQWVVLYIEDVCLGGGEIV